MFLEKLTGTIDRVSFHNEDTGFCVLKVFVKGQKELVTVIGTSIRVTPGEYIECAGIWHNDKTYGLQFKANQLTNIQPNSKAGIEKYLGSGLIRGIGAHFAKLLVKEFDERVFDVFDKEPNKILNIPGIGKKKLNMMLASWNEQRAISKIMVFLQENGVGTARSVRIYKTYGDSAIEKIRDNPYRLSLDINGIGFKTADALAMKLGISKDSVKRAQAGLRHILQEGTNSGHCALLTETVLNKTAELLEVNQSLIIQAIDLELRDDRIAKDQIEGNDCIYLAALYQSELRSARHILRLLHGKPPWGEINAEKALPWVEEKTRIRLSPSQEEAIKLALKEKVIVITGGPGVGKTTIVNSILKIVRTRPISLALCAPTGRAAKRLSETTHLTAKTIHRLLEFDPQERCFRRDQTNPLEADLVIIDEASMVDVVLMHSLLRAIPDKSALIIVGDVDQLPSVGPGRVLADLIDSQKIPVVRLTEIFRQAHASKIIINAHRVNNGEFPIKSDENDAKLSDFYLIPANEPEEIQDKLLQVVTKRIPERFGLDPLRDIQVLTPMNRGGLGTQSLNIILQQALNPKAEPRVSRFGRDFAAGDKVIQTVNDYDKEVFNGDIGRIELINLEEHTLSVDFDGRLVPYEFDELDELYLAYATSIHKSQGSEYPAVVIPLATQHYMLLARNLLYTAITRGKKLVVLIGQMKAIAMAINNVNQEKRLTKLSERLKMYPETN